MWQRGTNYGAIVGLGGPLQCPKWSGRPVSAAINGLGDQFGGTSCSMTEPLVIMIYSENKLIL